MSRTDRDEMGISLAKGPVRLLGLLALLYGIGALIFGGHSLSTAHIPQGAVHEKTWLGLGGETKHEKRLDVPPRRPSPRVPRQPGTDSRTREHTYPLA